MSLAKINSAGLVGIDGYIVTVEVDIGNGLPAFDIVGLPDTAVKESKERVRAAMKNCNMQMPTKRITVNLAPANIKKEGPVYDLPIAVAILLASEQIKCELGTSMFVGELSLDGRVRPVNGVLPMVMSARDKGIKKVYLAEDNKDEAAVVKGIEVYPVHNLFQLAEHLNGQTYIPKYEINIDELFSSNYKYPIDFEEVKGQDAVKRAVEVAVAGGHNILMIGSPGTGKSMIAQRIPTILPDMTPEESLEVTKIHSVAGTLPPAEPLMLNRPFRNPHHTVSAVALAGGGSTPKPGELSLAHNGVLFMDELPEFHRDVLEVMRQPMEDGTVTISRVQGTLTYPCNALFVGSMNPCKCGYYGSNDHICRCTPQSISNYRGKISGPLMDRIDIHIEVHPVKYEELKSKVLSESSADIKDRINKARRTQLERFKNDGIYSNSQMNAKQIAKYCELDEKCTHMLGLAFKNLGLSARAHSRILKVARTIADLDRQESIGAVHLAEAIQYRTLDRDFTQE